MPMTDTNPPKKEASDGEDSYEHSAESGRIAIHGDYVDSAILPDEGDFRVRMLEVTGAEVTVTVEALASDGGAEAAATVDMSPDAAEALGSDLLRLAALARGEADA